MSEFITAGGPFMWPLLACSVLIITISIERSWFLQNRLVSPKGLSNQIIKLINNDLMSKKQAIEISNLSSLGFLLINCLKYKDLQRDNLESKIEEKALEVKYIRSLKNSLLPCADALYQGSPPIIFANEPAVSLRFEGPKTGSTK